MQAKKEMMYSNHKQEMASVRKKVKMSEEIQYVKLTELLDFHNHPFKVEMNTDLFELMRSIEKDGVLVPLIARPNPNGNGYELISGHRRKAACDWAGIKEVPVIVRDLDDCEAVIAMVDSNLQRENIKPSEKAFAYRMKLDAIRQQGKRNDLTSDQVEPIIDNPTLNVFPLQAKYAQTGDWVITNTVINRQKGDRSNELLAKQIGESVSQIKRYIRLTFLIPKILTMVDEGKIAFTVGVELSYLKEQEQYELHAVMDLEQCTPSLSQASRMKRMSQAGALDMDEIYHILEEAKPNQREVLKIQADRINKYFPSEYTEKQKIDVIEKLLVDWHRR